MRHLHKGHREALWTAVKVKNLIIHITMYIYVCLNRIKIKCVIVINNLQIRSVFYYPTAVDLDLWKLKT